jgi:hypothetical protein
MEPFHGEPIKPTQFDRARQDSLGIRVRDVPTALADAFAELKAKGVVQ